MGGIKSANHSIVLSTRNVIVKEWTGLRIRSSVVDIASRKRVDVSRLLTDGGRYCGIRLSAELYRFTRDRGRD